MHMDASVSGKKAKNSLSKNSLDCIDMSILSHLEDSVMILDLDGRLMRTNPAGSEFVERACKTNPEGLPFTQIVAQHERDTVQGAITAAREGEFSEILISSRSPSGKKNWWEVSLSPIKSTDGQAHQILAILRDVSKRKRREDFTTLEHNMIEHITSGKPLDDVLEALVLLIEQYSEDTFCCVLLLGDDGKSVQSASAPNFSNDYSKAVHGLPVGPRVGSCGTAMYRKSRVIVEDIFTDPLWEGYDDIKNLSGGRACWSTPVFSDNNEVVGSFAIYARQARMPTDDEVELMDSAAHLARIAIDRHRTQQALMHSEARNRAILNAIPDWVFLTTHEGLCVDCHIQDRADLPVAPTDQTNVNIAELFPGPLGTKIADAIEQVSRSGNKEDIAGSINYRGEEHFFEASIVQCEDGKFLTLMRDVTQQTRAESEAAAQRNELAHLGRVATLGEITWTLAHELSQPLAIMRTNADVAHRLVNSNDLQLGLLGESIDDIISSNQRAGMVIDQLRSLLRKETSKFQPIDLNKEVNQVILLMQAEFINRKVAVQGPASNTEAIILGDRVQLQQVTLNLILNACEAMTDIPESDRSLQITTQNHGGSVELKICDNGHGIPEGELEQVFKPFVSHSKKEHSLGLGLAITRSIVTAHNGTILAENNPVAGATFRCRFPLANTQYAHRDMTDSNE